MKATVLLLCLLGFAACGRCDFEEDEARNKYDQKVKNDTLKRISHEPGWNQKKHMAGRN